MTELVRFFWQMALLRRAPQDLPGSAFLLQVLLAINLGLSFLLGLKVFDNPMDVLGATVLELALSAALLFAGLRIQGKGERWRQSYTALLGIGVIGGLVTLSYRTVAGLLGIQEVAGLLDLAVFFWLLVAMAHIVRHSFDIALPFAIIIVFLYTMFMLGLVAQWFAPELPAAQP